MLGKNLRFYLAAPSVGAFLLPAQANKVIQKNNTTKNERANDQTKKAEGKFDTGEGVIREGDKVLVRQGFEFVKLGEHNIGVRRVGKPTVISAQKISCRCSKSKKGKSGKCAASTLQGSTICLSTHCEQCGMIIQ